MEQENIKILTFVSSLISIYKNETHSVPVSVWIEWRELAQDLYDSDLEVALIDQCINEGKSKVKKGDSISKHLSLYEPLNPNEKENALALFLAFIRLQEKHPKYIPGRTNTDFIEQLKSTIQFSPNQIESADVLSKKWIEKKEQGSLSFSIFVSASLSPLLFDFTLRWIFLFLHNTGNLNSAAELFGVDEPGFFLLCQYALIPIFVILTAIFRENIILKSTYKILNTKEIHDLKFKTKNSAWNYVLVFFMVVQGIIIQNYLAPDIPGFALLIITIASSFYFLMILRHFSKKAPQYKEVKEQLEIRTKKEMEGILSHDENDELIVDMEVALKSDNEKMNAYVIEAALFGALAFGGFLTIISSSDFSQENMSLFNRGLSQIISDIIQMKGIAEFSSASALMFNKSGLLILLAYQSLFCSVFFLSVIASRLRFSYLGDQIDKLLQLARAYNEKEEAEIANSDVPGSKFAEYNERIKAYLKQSIQKKDELYPIIDYMKFFRTLGIGSFFIILITAGMFISVELSAILLFISVLSLVFFKLKDVGERLKNIQIAIQEFYYKINKHVYWVAWGIIIVSFILKSINIWIGVPLMLIGFLILFLHNMMSIFVPVHIYWIEKPKGDVFGATLAFHKLLETSFKVGLSFFFLGYVFKTLHWPAASIFIIFGLALLFFYFSFLKKSKNGNVWLDRIISIGLSFSFLAILFGMMHWKGSFQLYLISIFFLGISMLIIFRNKNVFLPFVRKSVMIMSAIAFLMLFPFTNWAVKQLSLNYSAYKISSKLDHYHSVFLYPIEEGGLSNAKSKEENEQLALEIENFNRDFEYMIQTGDHNFFNSLAWDIYTVSSNELLLNAALNWSKTSVDMSPDSWQNLDTYAALLYKLNRANEALPFAERAFELGKDPGTEELIQKIKSDLKVIPAETDSLK